MTLLKPLVPSARAGRASRATRAALLLAAALAAGCGPFAYYGHAAWGGVRLLAQRRDAERLLADPRTPPDLAERLRLALAIRDFASRELTLPDNRSYRTYAALERPYATWVVTAAPELSIEPIEWCFPVAGCVAYRGYFSRPRAERFAARLRARGHDVDLGGVAAFSTLGWFADPLLDTFLGRPPAELAGLIFHELAHQRVYASGDTAFDESFATAVEEEGVRRWLAARGEEDGLEEVREARRREEALADLVAGARERLAEVYGADRQDEWKRREKARLLEELRADYRRLAASWSGDPLWDAWFDEGLNNARLAAFVLYREHVPAFEALLARCRGELPCFYAAAGELAGLAEPARAARLAALAAGSGLHRPTSSDRLNSTP